MGLLATGHEVTYVREVNLCDQDTGDNNAAQQLELGKGSGEQLASSYQTKKKIAVTQY